MKGARLDKVKSAVELLREKLMPDDVISVVSFSDRAEVILPASRVDNSRILAARVRSIQASGGTEIFQGLSAGVQEMQRVSLAKHTNHLILLTDGHTYGDVEDCLRLSKESTAMGITFSAMGIGTEWNDQFLDKLVSPSGGQSAYIETPTEIIKHLRNQIKGLGQIHARNLRLLPNFPKSVSLQYGFKLSPFAQPIGLDSDPIRLGDIEGQTPLSFLLELSVASQPIETRINLSLDFLADIPSQQMRDRSISHRLQFLILSNAPKVEPPPSLVKAVRMLNMCRMNEKVWDEVEAGQLDVATTRMRHLSTRLLELGETNLARQAYAETQRLSSMGSVSPEGRKKIKYGTRALLTEAIHLRESDDHVR
jgi:Ca-activated chloride channel family protein